MQARSAKVLNQLLEALPRAERESVLAQCERVELVQGHILSESDEPIEHVYFPLTAFIALLARADNRQFLELGAIGNEGVLGATLVLGLETAPMRAVVQGSGSALRTPVAEFHAALARSPVLRQTLYGYLYDLTEHLVQIAACTHFHEIKPRLARWLLMTHDRAHSDNFHFTHVSLAGMLGVQRSAVTIAAGLLQRSKLIHYVRGDITIVSRAGLLAASCSCYGVITKK
ncbi:MAG: Crp/Fnr family transcriptional regulator [Gammaproteobacteria bacterium]